MNGGCGVFIRPEIRANAAHRTTIECCTLDRNCRNPSTGEAEILLQGETEGLRVIGNTLRCRPGKPGILIRKDTPPCEVRDNRITPSEKAVLDQRPRVTAASRT
jgi:hypothetical protein